MGCDLMYICDDRYQEKEHWTEEHRCEQTHIPKQQLHGHAVILRYLRIPEQC
jgi:hypothetical protein